MSPEVTTTQDFIAKINKIYNEKSRLNSIEFAFIIFIIVLLNVMNIVLNIGNHNELTSSLISLKIKVKLTLSLVLLGIYKFLPQKKRNKHLLTILIVFINGIMFLNNSLFLQFVFFSREKYTEASHALLFERDLRILTMAIILIYYRFEIKTTLLYGNFIMFIFFMMFHSLLYFKLGIWQNYEDYLVTFCHFFLCLMFIFISRWKNYFIKNERNSRREAIEIEAAKIKEELESVKKKLENNFKTESRPETASKADELLMKLKYLKFQALVNIKNKIISPNSGKRKQKRNSNFIITDSCGSYSPSKLTKNPQIGENQQSKY